MIQKKPLFFKSLILLGCVLVWLGAKTINHYRDYKATKRFDITKDITKIKIIENNKTFTIAKEPDNTWIINNQRANQEKIDSVLSMINTLGTKKHIANNKSKHAVYKVTTANKTLILMNKDIKMLSLIIGSQGPTWDSRYIRILPEQSTYLITNPIVTTLSTNLNDWKDLRINPFLKETITAFNFTMNNKIFSFTKQADHWATNTSEKTISIPSMNTILQPLAMLTSVTNKTPTHNSPAFFQFDLTDSQNTTMNYSIFPVSDAIMGIRLSKQPNTVFHVSANNVVNILVKINTLSPL
tara:strand:+ start:8173 stop:9063 length:891 start_codon:yes stop_codon:yes gene_type:complete